MMRREGRVGQLWPWIVTEFGGRTIIIKPSAADEQSAMEWGYENLESPFEVKMLPTRDRSRASSMLKGGMLNSGVGLEQSIRRVGHKRPQDYNNQAMFGQEGY